MNDKAGVRIGFDYEPKLGHKVGLMGLKLGL